MLGELWKLAWGPGLSGTDSQFLICKGGDRTSGAYLLQQSGSSPGNYWLRFMIGPFQNSWQATSTVPFQTNRWYHVAGTYDGQTLKLYLDGRLVNSNSVGIIPVGNSSPLYFSYDDVSGFPYYLTGQLDEVRLLELCPDGE